MSALPPPCANTSSQRVPLEKSLAKEVGESRPNSKIRVTNSHDATPSHTQRLLKSLDDQTGGVRLHIHFGLAVPEFNELLSCHGSYPRQTATPWRCGILNGFPCKNIRTHWCCKYNAKTYPDFAKWSRMPFIISFSAWWILQPPAGTCTVVGVEEIAALYVHMISTQKKTLRECKCFHHQKKRIEQNNFRNL